MSTVPAALSYLGQRDTEASAAPVPAHHPGAGDTVRTVLPAVLAAIPGAVAR